MFRRFCEKNSPIEIGGLFMNFVRGKIFALILINSRTLFEILSDYFYLRKSESAEFLGAYGADVA
jgi:hypothetical protein